MNAQYATNEIMYARDIITANIQPFDSIIRVI